MKKLDKFSVSFIKSFILTSIVAFLIFIIISIPNSKGFTLFNEFTEGGNIEFFTCLIIIFLIIVYISSLIKFISDEENDKN